MKFERFISFALLLGCGSAMLAYGITNSSASFIGAGSYLFFGVLLFVVDVIYGMVNRNQKMLKQIHEKLGIKEEGVEDKK
jgi:hypothetical protein